MGVNCVTTVRTSSGEALNRRRQCRRDYPRRGHGSAVKPASLMQAVECHDQRPLQKVHARLEFGQVEDCLNRSREDWAWSMFIQVGLQRRRFPLSFYATSHDSVI